MRRIVLANFIILASFTVWCCSKGPGIEKLKDGVVVRLTGNDTKAVRLRMISPEIVHIEATPNEDFSTAKSLMVLEQGDQFSDWKVEESADEVNLITSKLRVTVKRSTGEVRFSDANGNVLLQEKAGGGKTFKPRVLEKETCYALGQVFESPDDEAFYGLGAHQNGQMNYKGQDVELVQHNIVDVVPFLYSSKNYGLLWDNYSASKFGDPRDYQGIKSLVLYDKDGKLGGLTADYYVGDKIKESKVENEINYEYLETPQVESFPDDVSRHGKVVWSGSFSSEQEGIHKFVFYSSGYIKVWIDDKEVLNKWRQNWNPWTNKFNVAVKKGEKHSIRIDWTPDDHGYLAVKHLDPYPTDDQEKLALSSEVGDQIDYYFIAGKNADEVIHGYRTLTGKAPIIPKWAAGFWQSRERYSSQKDLVDVVKEYRKREIPLDNIVLDWQYWEDPKWGSHEFDLKRFPDASGMVKELHNDLHAHLMISVWPKFNKGTANYDEMQKNGFLFMHNIEMGAKRKDWVGIGYQSTFYDPFNPEAGKLFWKQIDRSLNSKGIDAWWLDATEPDIHSNLSVEERKVNMTPTALGPGVKYFNAYSLVNAKSVYEGQRLSSPEKRVFILTRSAYAGQQRYGAVTWSGDIVSRWSDFRDQIAAGINFSISGIPYWTMDIGGFAVERRYYNATGETLKEWRELNTRWFQFGAFCPIFRSHGQYPFREIYNLAETGSVEYNSMVYYDQLRYRLMPYIYSLDAMSYFQDYTIMRGLVMDFNADKAVHGIGDQYMFGPSLLINPVYEFGARERTVYLPAGQGWYDLYSGTYYEGGQAIKVSAPLERMPIFVKEGSIVPTGPELQYTSEKSLDPLTLHVYTGKDASFTLYEDEGDNYNYEAGKYATIQITYDAATNTVTIGDRQGEFAGMLKERKILITQIKKDKPVGLSDTQSQQAILYKGKAVKVTLK